MSITNENSPFYNTDISKEEINNLGLRAPYYRLIEFPEELAKMNEQVLNEKIKEMLRDLIDEIVQFPYTNNNLLFPIDTINYHTWEARNLKSLISIVKTHLPELRD